jgi:mannose-6-phosphate isomerase-like protein (cupin superfamily)
MQLKPLLPFVVGLVMAVGGVAFAQGAQPKADVSLASSAVIDAAVARATASPGTATRLLPDGAYQYFVMARKEAGLAEIHTQWTDVTTIRSGKGVLRIGQTLARQRETSPGEWRGDAVQDSVERQLGAGDLVVIPVGVAHQLSPVGNDPLVYVTVKVPADVDKVK